jgi:hypothetical protein
MTTDITDAKDILDQLDRPIWGAHAIGRVIGRSETEASYLLQKGLLPASKVGKYWVTTARRLMTPIQQNSKA